MAGFNIKIYKEIYEMTFFLRGPDLFENHMICAINDPKHIGL